MTENQFGEVGPVESAAVTTTPVAEGVVAGGGAPVDPVRRARGRRIAAVAGCALLALAVVGAVGYTVVTVKGADRDAGAPVWKFPKAAKEPKAVAAKGLRAVLQPYTASGYVRGPDIAQFGADAELTGREATALRKEELSGLPRSQRLLLEKQIDREKIKGIAMRSYLYPAAQETNTYTVEVQLAQMDEKAARNITAYENELLDTVTVFRKGPAVPGHKTAKCFLPKNESGEKLTAMVCFASVSDVMITLNASGTKAMDTKEIASFMGAQLDRIKTTGEAV
ncbi:hypothetical protein OG223_24920 [Streptomyces sp. NBC_01478]|uniref:hypothetical protein n=1 Tax=Streptomyces sp. NBC_01478 TaxID=2903882 RepID=UPI002E377B00|nr:hypothetical protein [Streptomyces sp. NBC_01478]